ncbi:MAG: phage shock protein operon transcriptional activator [Pseudomonadota bacterium]
MADRLALPTIVGEAPAFLETLEHVSRAAQVAKPVLVVGERGTGKELIASRLHFLSPRWEQTLVKVNCAALTESILESELFGHEAGAFTGAARQHRGHFERADDGTLILDELGTTSLRMQEKILRVIEYGEFERVGGTETLNVDVRIVASTNVDLEALTAAGRFRADLLDRLAFDVITIPPLRARVEDILPLANAFGVAMAAELHYPLFAGFTARAASTLLRHRWPGNVRELKNAVERSVYRLEDAEDRIGRIVFDPFASPYRLSTPDQFKPPAATQPAARASSRTAAERSLPVDFKAEVASYERRLVGAAMERANHKQKVAAELLGLNYHQLRNLLKKHDLAPAPARDR